MGAYGTDGYADSTDVHLFTVDSAFFVGRNALMNLIAPIMMFAVALGLFRPRMGKGEWIALSLWIVAVVIRYYIKGPV